MPTDRVLHIDANGTLAELEALSMAALECALPSVDAFQSRSVCPSSEQQLAGPRIFGVRFGVQTQGSLPNLSAHMNIAHTFRAAALFRGSPLARRAVALACGAALLAACGSSYPESEYPSAPPAGVSASPDDFAPAPPGALWRRDVNDVLDGGLGKFLQRADLKAEVHEGSFVGFRIVELHPPAWWQGVDLVPGDVITRVNGMPIEQPTDAHAAFESLRTSDKLVVSYLRDGKERELLYSIIEKPAAATAPAH